MGSFSGTCAISKLPINEGDKIKLVVLIPTGFGTNYFPDDISSIDEILQPCLLPLSGEYDGYGGISKIEEDDNSKIVYYSFKEFFGDVIDIHDKIKIDYQLSDIINNLTSINYYISNDYNKQKAELYNVEIPKEGDKNRSHFTHVLIREDIWNTIIKDYIRVDEITESFNKTLDYGFKNLKKLMLSNKEGRFKCSLMVFNHLLNSGFFISKERYIKEIIGNNEIIKKQWLDLIIISSFMSSINCGWIPQYHSSYDDYRYHNYKLLSNKIIEICEKENLKSN